MFSPTRRRQPGARSTSTSDALHAPDDFFFQPRRLRLNWPDLHDLDLQHVVDKVDINALQRHVETLTFAKITPDDVRQLREHANVLKLFHACQLIMEYLLAMQSELVREATVKEEQYEQRLQLERERRHQLKREVKQLRAQLQAAGQRPGVPSATAGSAQAFFPDESSFRLPGQMPYGGHSEASYLPPDSTRSLAGPQGNPYVASSGPGSVAQVLGEQLQQQKQWFQSYGQELEMRLRTEIRDQANREMSDRMAALEDNLHRLLARDVVDPVVSEVARVVARVPQPRAPAEQTHVPIMFERMDNIAALQQHNYQQLRIQIERQGNAVARSISNLAPVMLASSNPTTQLLQQQMMMQGLMNNATNMDDFRAPPEEPFYAPRYPTTPSAAAGHTATNRLEAVLNAIPPRRPDDEVDYPPMEEERHVRRFEWRDPPRPRPEPEEERPRSAPRSRRRHSFRDDLRVRVKSPRLRESIDDWDVQPRERPPQQARFKDPPTPPQQHAREPIEPEGEPEFANDPTQPDAPVIETAASRLPAEDADLQRTLLQHWEKRHLVFTDTIPGRVVKSRLRHPRQALDKEMADFDNMVRQAQPETLEHFESQIGEHDKNVQQFVKAQLDFIMARAYQPPSNTDLQRRLDELASRSNQQRRPEYEAENQQRKAERQAAREASAAARQRRQVDKWDEPEPELEPEPVPEPKAAEPELETVEEKLIKAARDGDAEELASLVGTGADVNVVVEGRTPLNWACEHNREDAVKLLLEKGADAGDDHDELEGPAALHRAAAKGNPDIVRLLLDAGASVNALSPDGQSALHYLAVDSSIPLGKRKAVAGQLLHSGVIKSLKNSKGQSASDLCRINNSNELAEFIDSWRR